MGNAYERNEHGGLQERDRKNTFNDNNPINIIIGIRAINKPGFLIISNSLIKTIVKMSNHCRIFKTIQCICTYI